MEVVELWLNKKDEWVGWEAGKMLSVCVCVSVAFNDHVSSLMSEL